MSYSDDLLALARKLAEGGHLPGISYLGENSGFWYSSSKPLDNHAAVEADIHLACHNAIVAKGWSYEFISEGQTWIWAWTNDNQYHESPGTTTLSLLTAFAAALEAK